MTLLLLESLPILAYEEMDEVFLVEQSARMDVDVFTRVVKAWAVRADPEAADRRWREQSAQRELFVSQVLDGTDIRGWLGHEEGQQIGRASCRERGEI